MIRKLNQMSKEDIKEAVRLKYGQVASGACDEFNFPVGREFAISVGYPEEELDRLPESMYESFTGAHNPLPFVDLEDGEIVLDLGCGAGLDIYFYSRSVGAKGVVHGLDISEEMVLKARENMEKMGIDNTRIVVGFSDDMPLDNGAVDIVASNGIYNLSPDKEAVMREVYRVLKPGGRTVFSEIVLKDALPESEKKSIDDWFRCIGGALPEEEFLSLMGKVGFERIEIISKLRNARTGHELAICANIRAYKPV